MKAKLYLFFVAVLCVAINFSSCKEGEVGPVGPKGEDGVNAAESCTNCHSNSQLITERLFQWESSVHATGGHYERNTASCSKCHTSQGFLEHLRTGTASEVKNPLPQNCYTCHQIHQTYTDDDWALTQEAAVTFPVGGETVDLGTGNLCISCHQARVPTPALPPVGEDAVYTVTNKRYGPHHGSQGQVFTGSGAYEIGTGYENSAHVGAIANACVACHMSEIDGANESGGHTFRVISEDGELNTSGCVQCHPNSSELETRVETVQIEIAGLLDSLGRELNSLGLIDDDLNYAVVPQEFTSKRLGILWNYKYVLEDKSLGIHNYKYVKTLLENSIEELE